MFKPAFDLAFVIHYIDGDTIHGIWNSNEGVYQGNRRPFYELTEIKKVSSIEVVYRDRRSGSLNRSILSIPTNEDNIKFVMLFRGLYSMGFSQVNEEKIASYEKVGIKNPKYIVIPGAIQISLLALKNDGKVRTPTEACKELPIISKLTVDSFGIFKRDENDTIIQ